MTARLTVSPATLAAALLPGWAGRPDDGPPPRSYYTLAYHVPCTPNRPGPAYQGAGSAALRSAPGQPDRSGVAVGGTVPSIAVGEGHR